ncbi:MAG: 3'(2'),5'-bisphosphate nucleotidase CysQ [Xanthomonadaceae bacterium]|nr:3'(2'),5'-bisphosphate nucleotidase CysQ [Xanthomonadaceae bacterium]
MSARQLQRLLPAVAALAEEAGRRIMEIYQAGFEVWHKNDDSPLTAADQAAHRTIVQGLAQLAPRVPVLSEEGRIPDFTERRQWQRYWLIDPLDGTKEFIKRNGEFTVNIALIEDGAPVLGVVHAPARDASWYAAAGIGAFRRSEGRTQAIRTRPARPPLIAMASRSHRSPAVDVLLARLAQAQTLSIGSSLKFCLIADGSADFYPRFGPTSEWDTAAAQCVVEQAGGRVVDLALAPLRYNTKPSLLNPDFVVFGDPHYDWSSLLEGIHGETR